jgi:uncharacterized membrane protein HdeD (DUF308 family)
MDSTIAESPATLATRGVVALLFGIIALLMPISAFWALVLVFGAYALVDGVSALISVFTRQNRQGRGWLALEGIAGITVGILTFVWPVKAAVVLIAFVSAWALITGVLKIILAIRLRREIRGEWLLALSGAASIILAMLMIATPVTATLALIWVLGVYALATGGMLIALAVRVRRWEQSTAEPLDRAA